MAYEIPQQLEYKEKIMFGLTFRQLAYLFLFAPLIAWIFFKTSLSLYFKIPICVMISALAVGFIFLDLEKHLRNIYFWQKHKKIEKPEKLAKFIPVKEIKDNLIITTDRRKLAVLKITPVNFAIKPDESKEAISVSFQKFLNSLDFPIQIMMNTEKLDLKEYFRELERKVQRTERFVELFEDYKEHLESLARENDILNRNFYLIIPERTDINIQLQICQDKLNNIVLGNYRLEDKELRKLLRDFFESKSNFYPVRIENYPSYVMIISKETVHDEKEKTGKGS